MFVILCICLDTPSEKTSHWQLPIVSRVLKCTFELLYIYKGIVPYLEAKYISMMSAKLKEFNVQNNYIMV